MAEAPSTSNSLIEWPTDVDSYELMCKIGQGAFASVWKAKSKTTQQECAIKVLNLDHVDSNLAEIRLEVQAMLFSSHPNVLQCHTAFVNRTDLWLTVQLMRKGSSLQCLQGARGRLQQLQESSTTNIKMEDHILYILHETLLGLQYIHDNGQIHRDIKAGNILLDGDGQVRIADFGVSGWLVNAGTQQEKAKTFVGTPCWMAPEVMEQIHGYDYKADIWSLGITALELAKGFAPYAKYPPMKVLIMTIQEDPPSLDTYDEEAGDDFDTLENEEVYSKSFRSLVDTCLQKNPAKRPKSLELLQSKYSKQRKKIKSKIKQNDWKEENSL
jgi:serine/threonine-protein kinase OSR1/STK39